MLYLLSGDHFILRKNSYYLNRTAVNLYSSHPEKIFISPLYCNSTYSTRCLSDPNEKITLIIKDSESYSIDVPSYLEIKNIIFDFGESMIQWFDDPGNCTSRRVRCCTVTESGSVPTPFAQGETCQL